jgi:ribosomal protein S18 acetylase RimI-like enzyme
MATVRPWTAGDADAVAALDTSFTTPVVLDVNDQDGCISLTERRLETPLTKRYPIGQPEDAAGAFVAELDGQVIGYGELVFEQWNGRGNVRHLYVSGEHRGEGVGSALLDELARAAQDRGASRLWIETQNTNYPAVQFYRHIGFVMAGFDRSLYGPMSTDSEVALFFSRDL